MKKFVIVITALLFSTFSGPVSAKKTKTEKKAKTTLSKQKKEIKAWKQQKSAMQPLQLKDLVEENHRLKTQNRKLAKTIEVNQEELTKLIAFKTQIEAHSNKSNQGEQAGENQYLVQGIAGPDGLSVNDWATDKNGQHYLKGLFFTVQIGAYRKRDLSNVLEDKKPQEIFEQEQSEGVNMYTLRHFRDYWKANQFKKELRAMGLKDAWIVALKDGKRVPLKEVLPSIIKKKQG